MRLFAPLLFLVITISCNSSKNVESTGVVGKSSTKGSGLNTNPRTQPLYRATTELAWDLIHTNLVVSFDLEAEQVLGEARLKLSPHFYAKKTLSLDAKAFDIKEIRVLNDSNNPFSYEYTGEKLNLIFSKTLSSNDTLELFIKYVANPNEVEERSGKAIRGGQGLYFINAQNNIPGKPLQIWTQGETDFSSCWFPTMDEPNQKTTQEIVITVPDTLKTLSNGSLEFSTENGDGTRTDYWVQSLPHSPYLAMIAIGDFSVFKEKEWRGKEVTYLTEKQYAKDAQYIFGATPRMLEFYSNKLGVDYPWDKYTQVVVRDFVSGAMENTSATLHGEFVQRHKQELIDYPQEGIIAHELFHQWFGDLVSCESWSNLALNEAFATYGEYLWVEESKSPFDAQLNLLNKQRSYLRESKVKKVDFVRFQYDSKLEVFDGHTYSKGACIMHQLRTAIGDRAFFKGLKTYLTRYAHSSAEMHQLRLVMEGVTGQDLNWFFNQWMFDNGHPELTITYYFDANQQQNFMIVNQTQNLNEYPLYQIPLLVKSYHPHQEILDTIWVKNELDTFYLKGSTAATWIDYDSQDYLLAEIKEPNKTTEAWFAQFTSGKGLADMKQALATLSGEYPNNPLTKKAIKTAISHGFFDLRLQGLSAMTASLLFDAKFKEEQLLFFLKNDNNSKVRAKAIELYRLNYTPKNMEDYYSELSSDSSYTVLQSVIKNGIKAKDTLAVLTFCKAHEKDENEELRMQIAQAYSELGNYGHLTFFKNNFYKIGAYKQAGFLYLNSQLLLKVDRTDELMSGYSVFQKTLLQSNSNWIKSSAANSLKTFYIAAKEDVDAQEKTNEESPKEENKTKLEEFQMRLDAITATINKILNQEKNIQVIESLTNL